MLVGEVKKKQHGAAVYLSLHGRARDAMRSNTEHGLEELIRLLDALYLKDSATQAYCAFRDFVEYRRRCGETFSVLIVEFEKWYRDVKKHDMKLPTGAKAYFLLQAANLTLDNEQLVRATTKIDYCDMKNQIQKVFGDTVGKADHSLPVKTEESN